MRRKNDPKSKERVSIWPSHAPFEHMISYSVRGHNQPAFPNCTANDHIADLCDLMHDDIDDFLWFGDSNSKGVVMREMFDELSIKIDKNDDLAAAQTLYALATHAAGQVLSLYLRNRHLFDKIAPHRKLLPCLASIHPKTANVVASMAKDSKLGLRTPEAHVVNSTAWFTSDAPANIYARAIINSVQLNRFLEPVEIQQEKWLPYEQEHGERILVKPFPKFIAGIDELPVPMMPRNVLAYWRKGKEMILEEMPDFHLRPEWAGYHTRKYRHGAKTGAIQHAIFKDILVALRTIAHGRKSMGSDKRTKPRG